MASEYPLKHVRLQQLYEAGFNIADFVCFPPGQLNEEELRRFFDKHGRVSLRHFHADEKRNFRCPFFPEQTDWQTVLRLAKENNVTYYTLCNENLILEDSQYAGNIVIYDERSYMIEYFKGCGTPRDIDKKNVSEIERFTRRIGEPMNPSTKD